MRKTISSVRDPNPWTDRATGQLKGHFVNGTFDDGMPFSALVNGQRQAADEVANKFRDLIGEEADFDFQERTTNNGSKELSLKSWPGKPQQQGGGFRPGGGGRQWSESYAQSRECKETEQRSIQRAVALERALGYSATFSGQKSEQATPEYVLGIAEQFFAWLSEGKPAGKIPITADKQQPSYEPTDEYKSFVTWLEQKVRARVFVDKETTWKAAMTYAHEIGCDHAKLRGCNDHSVFLRIRDKLTASTRAPNAYQPVGVGAGDDDLPF